MESIEFYHHEIRISIELKNNIDKYGKNIFHFYNNLDQLKKYMLDLSPEDEKITSL